MTQAVQQQRSDADDFFGGGADTISFADRSMMNVWVGGEILVEPQKKQQKDYVTKEPKFWPKSTDPIWVLVVTLQTQIRNPQDPQDNGVRRLFIQSGMKAAVQTALTRANTGMTVGGQLWVRWIGEKASEGGGNPAKIYEAHYVPGSPSGTQANEFFQQAEPAAQPQQGPQNGGAPPQGYPANGQPVGPPQGYLANGAPQGQPQTPWQQPAAPTVQTNAYASPGAPQAAWQQPGQPQPQVAPQQPQGQQAPWQQPQGALQSGPVQGPPPGQQTAPWQQAGPPQGAPGGQQFPQQGPPPGQQTAPWQQAGPIQNQMPQQPAPWLQQGPTQTAPSGPPQGAIYTGPAPTDPSNPFGGPPQQPQSSPYPTQ